jgi:hypothetical protein
MIISIGAERRRQIDSTYDEFIKANNGKNPILGI